MKINDENWECKCNSIAQKQELFDYAASKGVPVLAGPLLFQQHGGTSYRDDEDLYIGWLWAGEGFESGLVSNEADTTGCCDRVSPPLFKMMCREYATANGVPA